jgi:hypothetical protein
MQSPQITSVEWGRMVVEGLGAGHDFRLWPGGGAAWDWKETGTHHRSGIQLADIKALLAKGCRILVLSSGMERRLALSPAAADYLKLCGTRFYFEKTDAAVARYNKLAAANKAVGGLFHLTC